jgi:hypothetical protein
LSWAPYGANTTYQDRVLVFGTNGTGVLKFNDRTFESESWSYAANTDGLNTATITVNKTAHGLSVGDSITTASSTVTGSNPPNGVFKVFRVVSSNAFTFITNTSMSGLPTGTPGDNMSVRLGWQGKYRNNIRTRGYGVDSTNRLWLTSRNSTVGRITIHLLSESIPSSVNIRLQDYDTSGTDDTKYIYSGSDINTNLYVDVYNSVDERIATELVLSITGDTMRFADGDYYTKTITTNSSATLAVPVVITGAGRNSVSVSKVL